MEVNIALNDAIPDLATTPRPNHPLPSISQLPAELLAQIFHLSLPPIDFKLRNASSSSCSHVKRLYILRSITKWWQTIFEGTPSFWTTIASELPSHVIEESIIRSSSLPLIIIHDSMLLRPNNCPPEAEFLKAIQHTRPRWSALILDLCYKATMSSYLGAPLPLLQTIIVNLVCDRSPGAEPLELLGGYTSNLRFVELSGFSIRWRMGSFIQLKCLKLERVTHDSLTAPLLLDALHASPDLQVLKLTDMAGTDIPQPSPTITLHRLKCIELHHCNIALVQCILRQVKAPSCTRLSLRIIYRDGLDLSHFLNEALRSFHPILRETHRLYGESEVLLDPLEVEWRTRGFADMEGFSINIILYSDPFFIEWIDRILEDYSGLVINFSSGVGESLLRRIAPMLRVTKVIIGGRSFHGAEVSTALQFLSKPLPTNPSLPSLPCLQELRLPSAGWNIQDLLQMVQSRLCVVPWETMERTSLTITVQNGGIPLGGDGGTSPRLLLDLITVVKIREASSVKSFKHVGWKDPRGMRAVVWDV